MDKKLLLEIIIKKVEDNLSSLVASAQQAKDAATNPESKAESKWDTFGLESSYLAGAQAKRAKELQAALYRLKQMSVNGATDFISTNSIVQTQLDGDRERWFFVNPYGGGVKVNYQGIEISVITPQSPLGMQLLGKTIDDTVELDTKNGSSEYYILKIL